MQASTFMAIITLVKSRICHLRGQIVNKCQNIAAWSTSHLFPDVPGSRHAAWTVLHNQLDGARVVTHHFALDQLEAAYDTFRTGHRYKDAQGRLVAGMHRGAAWHLGRFESRATGLVTAW